MYSQWVGGQGGRGLNLCFLYHKTHRGGATLEIFIWGALLWGPNPYSFRTILFWHKRYPFHKKLYIQWKMVALSHTNSGVTSLFWTFHSNRFSNSFSGVMKGPFKYRHKSFPYSKLWTLYPFIHLHPEKGTVPPFRLGLPVQSTNRGFPGNFIFSPRNFIFF